MISTYKYPWMMGTPSFSNCLANKETKGQKHGKKKIFHISNQEVQASPSTEIPNYITTSENYPTCA
jgi:hypothetical protein